VSPSDWRRHAVVYQIYPLSFSDSDDDGKGDLAGIVQRIDYLEWLGIDVVWLGPIFKSPMRDFGFDVSDFTMIDATFGTLDDFERLVDALHVRGIRLILDFVPNHTSNEHAWFKDSRSARDSAMRDWYVWCDPGADGGPPNNWTSRFGGSAWKFDEATGQYYYHAFLEEQPDLNWRNPAVRAAIANILSLWIRRGVDGFRLDAAAVLAEDELLRDDPPNPKANADTPPPERRERVYTNYRPEVLDWLAELRSVIDRSSQAMLFGEVDTAEDKVADFFGTGERPILHAPLVYRLLEKPWEAKALAEAIGEYLRAVPPYGSAVWGIGSHDKSRIASRVGQAQARVAALIALTLPGIPIVYAGDEIGMEDVCRPTPTARDPFERRLPGYGLNRDAERTPMQWDATRNAGFSRAEPWLPVAPDYARRNVSGQRADDASLLHLYRRLLHRRRHEPALTEGTLTSLHADGDVLSYDRVHGQRRLAIVANLGHSPRTAKLQERGGTILLSTHGERDGEAVDEATLALDADEAVIIATA
jgi:alpha-glucosidase